MILEGLIPPSLQPAVREAEASGEDFVILPGLRHGEYARVVKESEIDAYYAEMAQVMLPDNPRL